MSIEQDLVTIARQEQLLCFDRFDERTAWEVGTRLKTEAERRGAVLAIDVTLAGRTVFFYGMTGTSPNNTDWVRRKRNTAQHFQRSSYGFGLQLERDKTNLAEKFGLSLTDYAVHGGSFPIRVTGTGVVGAITISGLPQREDHKMVVAVLADFLGKPLTELAME